MRRRPRKFVGTSVMLAFVILYALVAMTVAQTDHIHNAGRIVQSLFFAAVGLGWVVPLLPLIRWMERPDDDPPAGMLRR